MAGNKIKAFTLRKKVSKAGTVYWTAPYGEVDLLAFQSDSGDIEVTYAERASKPATAANRGYRNETPVPPGRPKIIPRPQPPTPPPIAARPGYVPNKYAPPIPQDFIDHTRGGPDLYESGDPGPTEEDLFP